MINAVKFKIAPDSGKLIENVTAIELLRRGKELFYYEAEEALNGKKIIYLPLWRWLVSL